MRRCYRGVALVLGAILLASNTLSNSCRLNVSDVYAAEDPLAKEEVSLVKSIEETTIPEITVTPEPEAEIQTGEENVDTEILAEESNTESTESVEENESTLKQDELNDQFNGHELGYNDYNVLLKIVEAEAGGEDLTGKMLVANVILNRVKNDRFPNTVKEVVYQKTNGSAQFSPTVDGRINTVSISQETLEAVERVLNGEDYSNGALYFRSVKCNSTWFDNSLRRVVEHGNHIFYTI